MSLRYAVALMTAALAWNPPAVAAGQARPVAQFSAFAINMSNIATGASSQVTITIERWSTDAERQRLIEAFMKGGQNQDPLLNELQRIRPRAGFFQLPGQLGYDIRYAREFPGEDGGRQIILVTDRRIEIWEAMDRPRTIDYPFTLIELHLNSNGEGEGRASVLTRITYDKETNTLELENYGTEPVRLNNIRQVQ